MIKYLRRNGSIFATLVVFAVLFAVASFLYSGFGSWRVAINLFGDNAFLGITALGMTLVILSGGIDLSVGSVVGFTTIFVATQVGKGTSPWLAWIMVLILGTGFGALLGWLIHGFKLPAFLVTLAGMFFARGAGFWISQESVAITHPLYNSIASFALPLGDRLSLSAATIIFLAAFVSIFVVSRYTRFGRNLLAVGGNETSALLMGLPIGETKVAVYALNGFCSALAGIVATFYTGGGNPATGVGLELDAIAVVVMGGTLLSGGRGSVIGTMVGVLIFGTIQSALLFDGRLNPWWIRIVVGGLLLAFILLQRVLTRSVLRRA